MRSRPLTCGGRSAAARVSGTCCRMTWSIIYKSTNSTPLKLSRKTQTLFSHPCRGTRVPPAKEDLQRQMLCEPQCSKFSIFIRTLHKCRSSCGLNKSEIRPSNLDDASTRTPITVYIFLLSYRLTHKHTLTLILPLVPVLQNAVCKY